jgi:hypothetical protein
MSALPDGSAWNLIHYVLVLPVPISKESCERNGYSRDIHQEISVKVDPAGSEWNLVSQSVVQKPWIGLRCILTAAKGSHPQSKEKNLSEHSCPSHTRRHSMPVPPQSWIISAHSTKP